MSKVFIFLVMILSFNTSVSALGGIGVMGQSLTDTEVETRIQSIQGEIPTGTPTLINTSYDRKGNVGAMLSNIFDVDKKIKSYFIQAFKNIFGAASQNNIPKWNGQVFQPGTIWDIGGNIGIGTKTPSSGLKLDVAGKIGANKYCDENGNNCIKTIDIIPGLWAKQGANIFRPSGNVGIGISTPATKLHVNGAGRFDGGVQVDGRRAISNTNYSHTAQSTVNNRYGFYEVRNNSGLRGAYFGYGNGIDLVDLRIDAASKLNISGGNVGIGKSPANTLKLDVNGKIGATEYCDENGLNCFTAAAISTGTGGVAGGGIVLGTSSVTKIIAPSGTQCIPSIVKNSASLVCEYDKYTGKLQVTSAGTTGKCGYTCDLANVATYTEYTVFKKAKYWGGARWFGADSNQRVVSATAQCNPGDKVLQKRMAYHSNGMNTGNIYTSFINEYNAMNSAKLDANGVAWINIVSGFAYQRSYNGYNRLGNRGSYAVAEVKCLKEN